MAEQKKEDEKKIQLPPRCTDLVEKVWLKPDVSLVGILGQSRTLELGSDKVYRDVDIQVMALHPHGVFIVAQTKLGLSKVIIPTVNLIAYRLMEKSE